MVPADVLLDTALEEGCDIVGLLGPHHALARRDGERRQRDGAPRHRPAAADRRRHDLAAAHRGADRPEYGEPVVHVIDASRVVGVGRRPARPRAQGQARPRQPRRPGAPPAAARRTRRRSRSSPTASRSNGARRSTGAGGPARAAVHRLKTRRAEPRRAPRLHRLDVLLHRVGAEGPVPADPRPSAARRGGARAVRGRERDAGRDRGRRLLTARGVYGFWPANAEGDDIVLEDGTRFPMLRQQADHGDDRPNRSLADYIAPAELGPGRPRRRVRRDGRARRGRARGRVRGRPRRLPAIMVKALADRLAEAFAEWLHEQARREWYEAGPKMPNEELIEERYRGIRPAFGYPACPDHRGRRRCSSSSTRARSGIDLTEHFAMTPAAAVSGLYFAHPAARYFNVGRLGRTRSRTTRRAAGSTAGGGDAGCARTSRTTRTRSLRSAEPGDPPGSVTAGWAASGIRSPTCRPSSRAASSCSCGARARTSGTSRAAATSMPPRASGTATSGSAGPRSPMPSAAQMRRAARLLHVRRHLEPPGDRAGRARERDRARSPAARCSSRAAARTRSTPRRRWPAGTGSCSARPSERC